VVQQIADGHGNDQVITAVSRCYEESTAFSGRSGFRAESEGFRDPQIDALLAGAASEISRQQLLARDRTRIEQSVLIPNQTGAARIGRDSRTAVEQRGPVQIASGRDVERRAGLQLDQGAQPDIPFRIDRPTDRDTLTHVRRCRAVLAIVIVRIRGEGADAVGIGLGAIHDVRTR